MPKPLPQIQAEQIEQKVELPNPAQHIQPKSEKKVEQPKLQPRYICTCCRIKRLDIPGKCKSCLDKDKLREQQEENELKRIENETCYLCHQYTGEKILIDSAWATHPRCVEYRDCYIKSQQRR